MYYILFSVIIILIVGVICEAIYPHFGRKKYMWNVYRDDMLISVGNYSYIPAIGDEVYYYVMDKFGAITDTLELGKVVRVARLENIIFVYAEYIEQKH
ncbi:MAG: hypothetical protein WC942_10975 [Clostridia bacterium]|jgi:hypothetical protein